MAAYTVINGTPNQLVNVDGATDVDSMCYKNGITLDGTQLAALLDGSSFDEGEFIAVITDLTSKTNAQQIKRVLAIAGLYASS